MCGDVTSLRSTYVMRGPNTTALYRNDALRRVHDRKLETNPLNIVSSNTIQVILPVFLFQYLLRIWCGRNWTAGSSVRQSAMHERYPWLKLSNTRCTAQLDRWCPRITPPTRHLTRAVSRVVRPRYWHQRPHAGSHNWAFHELPAAAFDQWGTQGTTAAVAPSDDAGAAPRRPK